MVSPAAIPPISRTRAAVLSAGIAAATWGVAASDPGPATHGRGLASLVLLIACVGLGLAYLWGNPRGRIGEVVLALLAVSGAWLTASAPNGPSSAFAFGAVFSAGVRYGGLRPFVIVVLASIAVIVGALVYGSSSTGALAYGAGFLAATLGAGARRTAILRVEEAELLLAQVQRSREEQLRAAALDERSRIAREIHDVLAHSMAGLTIHLDATRMLVEQGADRDRVLDRVERAHALAREGLRETRRAVEALRGDVAVVGQQLALLVDEYRAGTGAEARLDVVGDVDSLPADAALAIVRVTQEALTNARKHAPGAAVTVAVTREDAAVALRIASRASGTTIAPGEPAAGKADHGAIPAAGPTDLSATGGGYGLRGMRERAEILGGTLAAGPADAGWIVELRLPLDPVGARP